MTTDTGAGNTADLYLWLDQLYRVNGVTNIKVWFQGWGGPSTAGTISRLTVSHLYIDVGALSENGGGPADLIVPLDQVRAAVDTRNPEIWICV